MAKPYRAFISGIDLVVQRAAQLPSVCMKCGAKPAATYRVTTFSWNPDWVRYTIFFLGPILWGLLVLGTRVSGMLAVPLCAPCDLRWRQGATIRTAGALAMIAALVVGVLCILDSWATLGFVIIAAGVIGGVASAVVTRDRFLSAKKVDDETITFADVDSKAADTIVAGAATLS